MLQVPECAGLRKHHVFCEEGAGIGDVNSVAEGGALTVQVQDERVDGNNHLLALVIRM